MSEAEPSLPGGLTLEPFRATRYAGVDLAAVTSPPYDVVEPDSSKRLEASNPYNVVRLILPRDVEASDRYREATRVWHSWLHDKVLSTDDQDALWVYEQTGAAGLLVGVVGTIPIDRPTAVLPHEDVMPVPVADRAELMDSIGANLEPILLVHDPAPSLPAGQTVSVTTQILEEVRRTAPAFEVATDDGAYHRLWAVTDRHTHAQISADLQQRSALIADGHHRFVAYQRIQRRRRLQSEPTVEQPWDRGLALVVDGHAHPLRLGAIHRVVHGLNWATATALLGPGIEQHNVRNLAAAQTWLGETSSVPRLVVTDSHEWTGLTAPDAIELVPRPDRSPQWRQLPTAVLHELLLPHRWQVRDDAVTYHHDIPGALRTAVGEGIAVLLPALPLTTVIDRAAAGELLPRKSTSFGPKPRTGLLMRTFDDANQS